jgi:acyl transferase domain-containing protein/cyclopropane fatty-acyl-phospholipid synthase-like methyltransferase/aryl carrier-like protein
MSKGVEKNESVSSIEGTRQTVEALKARLQALEYSQREPIAIIGMACRLPGEADHPELFWENLRDGVDSVTEIPSDRFDINQYYDPNPDTPGKTHIRSGAFVKKIQDFDPTFAGIAPKNAYFVDPQHRMFAGTCWAALEDAGIAPLSLDGSVTGVFVGIWSVEYWHRLASRPLEQLDGQVVGGNLHSLASGAVSYMLGLKGPAMSVDTACSASLVTVDLAVQSLRNRGCDMALAGGVNVILGPENYICFSGIQVLSPDGRCKSFDASADGFGRGEGAGVVVLKRLSDALRDGDRIYALIHGTATNQDGKTSGIAVPNGPAQEAAARKALAQSGIKPADVTFVEAHGTGTAVGDPIEAIALANVYGEGRAKDEPLLLGSVKTNIGHLESAAGIAGLIKVVLALKHEAIPPNLHFKTPNPEIPWDRLCVKVVTELTPWLRSEKPRYAAVSSFGVSGTNAHLVIGEAPVAEREALIEQERPLHLLVLSTKDKDGLKRSAKHYVEWIEKASERNQELDLEDVAYTANTGRSPFRERLAVVAGTTEELRKRLASFRDGEMPPGLVTGKARSSGAPALGFLFTGQGSQYAQMGRRLYETQPTFRRTIDRCDEILRPVLDVPLLDAIYPDAGVSTPLDDTAYTQPALFAVEYALAELWKSWGVEPSFVLGHSVGEYVAACVAGVFGLEDGLKLIAERGRLMSALPREGRMVAILADEARVVAAVAPFANDIAIAALNGPENVVISGRDEAVEKVVQAFEAEGVETRRLTVSHAFHSPLMEPARLALERTARGVSYAKPQIPLISNLTGAPAGEEIAAPEYWISHIRKPVRFADGIVALQRQGCELFLEIGPRPVLSGMGEACLPKGTATFVPSLRPGQDDWERVLLSLGELFVRGVSVDWKAFDDGYDRVKVSLPPYPFKGEPYWVGPSTNGHRGNGSWLNALLDDKEKGRLSDEIRNTGRFSDDETRLLVRLLDVFAEEYAQRLKAPTAPAYKAVVADYYNTMRNATPDLEAVALEEHTETYLTFAPLPEIIPGFSWFLAMMNSEDHQEMARICLEGQQVLREGLFRKIDFRQVRKVLDFGCGYASDLCTLALKHPHIEGTGYTLSVEQMKVGQKKAKRLGLDGRVQIHNCDSTKDEFPHQYDLAFGFEVAHHVPNKPALFSHISRHLNPNGHLVLADFISRTGFSIDYDAISSYFPTTDEWVELLSENHLQVVDCVDISREMSYFLYDPQFDKHLAEVEAKKGASEFLRGLKSYDRLGKIHGQGLALYVLMTSEKRSDLSVPELKRLNREALAEPTPYSEISIPHGCYEVEWIRKDRNEPWQKSGEPGRWLILADQGGAGEALARRLQESGATTVSVSRGPAFGRVAADRFTANPARREDFVKLLEETTNGGPFRGILHLWSLDSTPTERLGLESLRDAQLLGSASVIHLIQALVEAEGFQKPRLWLVTEQAQALGEGPIQIAQAPLFGLGKAFQVENPEIWGGMVDVDAGAPEAKVAAILGELAGPDGECHVAYRRGERFVPRLARRHRPERQRPEVRPDASYLVTGGTGGLGLKVAEWLVDEGARHVVLTSRRGPSETALEEIRNLEARGARILALPADVTSAKDMAAVLEKVASTMPPLRGVVHAAGTGGGTMLAQQTWDRYNEVLDIKVAGSFNVHALTRDLPLDFFVSFSSASSLLASPGQASYSAGNAFKDALGHHRVRVGLKSLTVNWGAWADVGMAANMSAVNRKNLQDRGMGLIDPSEALPVLGDLITEGRPQVGIITMNWVKFLKAAGVSPYLEKVAAKAEPAVSSEPTGMGGRIKQAPAARHRDMLSEYVQERVAKVLGYTNPEQVDRELTLLELGFDSLMAVQLRNAIRTNLEVDVPIGKLFDSTSIEQLTDLLQERIAAAASRPPAPGGEHVEMI